MQNIILSIIGLDINDSQKLALIKEICEKLSNSRDEEEKALKLCGEFQSNLDNLQDQINDLESDIDDLKSSFEDLQNDFDNLEVDGGVFEELESKMGDLEERSNKLIKFLIKKGIIDEKEITEEEIPNNN